MITCEVGDVFHSLRNWNWCFCFVIERPSGETVGMSNTEKQQTAEVQADGAGEPDEWYDVV